MPEKNYKILKQITVFLCLSLAGSLLSAAAEVLLAGRARIRSEKVSGDVYIIGKKSNPKAVCITNLSPVNSSINVIKRYL